MLTGLQKLFYPSSSLELTHVLGNLDITLPFSDWDDLLALSAYCSNAIHPHCSDDVSPNG